jgi:hypothetical protein
MRTTTLFHPMNCIDSPDHTEPGMRHPREPDAARGMTAAAIV